MKWAVVELLEITWTNFMGRYYFGDIEGKMWFGIQSSNDASFFGGSESQTIQYYFENGDVQDIKKGIEECEESLGRYLKYLEKYFKDCQTYNDKELGAYLGKKGGSKKNGVMGESELHELLIWYSRLLLGRKILKCVEETGECNFEVET